MVLLMKKEQEQEEGTLILRHYCYGLCTYILNKEIKSKELLSHCCHVVVTDVYEY